MYLLLQIIRNGSLIQRGSILLKLKVGLWGFFFSVKKKKKGGVTILLLSTLSDDALYLSKVLKKKISKGFKADTISKLKFSEGHYSLKNGQNMVYLCTSSDDALYLYQVLGKYFKGFQSF